MLKKNFFWNKNNKNNICLIVSRGRYLNDINNIIGFIAANKIFKLYPIIISDLFYKNYDDIYKYFNFEDIKYVFSYKRIFENPKILFLSILSTIFCLYNTKLKGFNWLIDQFHLKSIKIGDLIYDSFIRYNHGYLNPRINLKFINQVFQSSYRTIKLVRIVEKLKPRMIFIGTDGYAHNSGIMMRIGLQYKIKTYEAQSDFILKTENFQTDLGRDHLRKIYLKRTFDLKKKIIEKHYKKKIISKSKPINYVSSDTFFLANKHKTKTKKEILNEIGINLKEYKISKIVLIASHCFSDAPHMNGYHIFRDYYNHVEETLKFINTTKSVQKILWILKKHPATFFYREEEIFKTLAKKYLSKNIVICPKNINTHDLIKVCDNVITTKGTIALEFAAEGKAAVLAGASPFSHLGFTLDPRSKFQYFNYLRNIKKLKKLNSNQIFNAKKAMIILDLALHKYRLKKSKIANSKKIVEKYQKGLLLGKFVNNQKKFINDVMNNFNKMNLLEDNFYKSLKNFFKKEF